MCVVGLGVVFVVCFDLGLSVLFMVFSGGSPLGAEGFRDKPPFPSIHPSIRCVRCVRCVRCEAFPTDTKTKQEGFFRALPTVANLP